MAGVIGQNAADRPLVRALLIACVIGAALAAPRQAMAIEEFPAPGGPAGIVTGPDGALWFTEETGNKIGRMTTSGVVTNEIPIPTPASLPAEIAVGPDNKLWFTEFDKNRVGRVDSLTTIVDFPVPGAGSQPDGIVAAAGAIWFTQFGSDQIGRMDPTTGDVTDEYSTGNGPGDITLGTDAGLWFTESLDNSIRRLDPITRVMSPPFPVPNLGGVSSDPSGITAAPGALWFTQSGSNEIGKITTSGTITEYGGTGADPSSIATGPDDALWFTQSTGNQIGRITTNGAITNQFSLAAPSEPSGIAAGPDRALWFTQKLGNRIGRIAVAPPFVPTPGPPPVAPATPSVKKCKVPKLKGLTVKKARSKLKKAGCKYRIRGKGRVRSTSPKAGRTTTKRVIVRLKAKKRARR